MGNGNLQSVQKGSKRHRGKMLENPATSTNKIITLKITLQYAKKKKKRTSENQIMSVFIIHGCHFIHNAANTQLTNIELLLFGEIKGQVPTSF